MHKLLVIEDSEFDRMMIKRQLAHQNFETEFGFETHFEESAEIALRRIFEAQESFNAIITDFNLPGISGLQFSEVIRTNGIDIPIILMTGQGDEYLATHTFKAGLNDYIVKDSRGAFINQLMSALSEAIQIYKRKKELEKAEQAIKFVQHKKIQIAVESFDPAVFVKRLTTEIVQPIGLMVNYAEYLQFLLNTKFELEEIEHNINKLIELGTKTIKTVDHIANSIELET